MRKTIAVILSLLLTLMLFIGCSPKVPQEDYDQAISDRDAYANESKQLQTDLDKANSDNEVLSGQLSELTDAKDALQIEYDEYVRKSTEYNALLDTEKQSALDVASKNTEIEDLNDQISALNSQIAELEGQIADLDAQKTQLEDDVYVLENKIIAYKEAPVQLRNGNFTAGVDFPAGVYDLYAISGSGTVSTTNTSDYANSIFQMMAARENAYYITSYQNVTLDTGTVLQVSGVTIELRVKAE